jgi:hypothetical protein
MSPNYQTQIEILKEIQDKKNELSKLINNYYSQKNNTDNKTNKEHEDVIKQYLDELVKLTESLSTT